MNIFIFSIVKKILFYFIDVCVCVRKILDLCGRSLKITDQENLFLPHSIFFLIFVLNNLQIRYFKNINVYFTNKVFICKGFINLLSIVPKVPIGKFIVFYFCDFYHHSLVLSDLDLFNCGFT